ncbi:DUF3951 domain-containing protein [Priestia megaterium]|uniref:DUF3951 domain-containing protein n=1 Tax=Priestia megaterium TaxID=1404 RepID=UPI001EDDB199|nr:DUF3951 domain-containing protein [Priestia megaterium]MDH3170595.1 DUF3951 domain-containing protein [Priestia megaterium]
MVFSLLVLVAILTVSIPLMIIIVKMIWHRKLPRNYYTPFDYLLPKQKKSFMKSKMNKK